MLWTPPISKTIQIRQRRHVGYFWRSKDELISDVLQWTLTHSRANVRRPTRTYQQVLVDKLQYNKCLEKNSLYLSDRTDLHMIVSLSIAFHAFTRRIVISLSVDETLLSRYVNLATNFRIPPLRVETDPSQFKHMYSVLFGFTKRSTPLTASFMLYCWDLAWVSVCVRSATTSA